MIGASETVSATRSPGLVQTDSDKAVARRRSPSATRAWTTEAVDALRRRAAAHPSRQRAVRLAKVANRLDACGFAYRVMVCGNRDCAEVHPAEKQWIADGKPPRARRVHCDVVGCPRCADWRRRHYVQAIQQATAQMTLLGRPWPEDVAWHVINLTTPNPTGAWTGVDAIRAATEALLRAVQALWSKHLKVAGPDGKPITALQIHIEVGAHGMVHAHGIYFGPRIAKRRLLKTVRRHVPGTTQFGFAPVEGCEAGFQRWTAYMAKGLVPRTGLRSITDNSNKAGAYVPMISAEQAVDLVEAFEGIRRVRTYGWLRGISRADVAEAEFVASLPGAPNGAEPMPCEVCRHVGWRIAVVGAKALGGLGEWVWDPDDEGDPIPRAPPEPVDPLPVVPPPAWAVDYSQIPEGDTDFPIVVSLKGFRPRRAWRPAHAAWPLSQGGFA